MRRRQWIGATLSIATIGILCFATGCSPSTAVSGGAVANTGSGAADGNSAVNGSSTVNGDTATNASGLNVNLNPPLPKLTPLSVSVQNLSGTTVAKDMQTVHSLLSAHPGDGTVRGPDDLVYNISATIDPSKHEIALHMTVHLHNNLGTDLSELYFNVWPDAYHYRKDGSYQKVTNVRVDGESTVSTLKGTVLYVKLTKPIKAGANAKVDMDVLAVLPSNIDRYGYEGTKMNFGNWFPMLAVHDSYGWVTPPYYADGESFYSLTGAFHLHVTAPKDFTLAISGEEQGRKANADGTETYDYQAIGVRDVAMVGDSQFKTMEGAVDGVKVYTYYTAASNEESQAGLMEQTAKQALHEYNQEYGRYPFSTLRIVAMKGWFGGMEYPQLDMISFQPRGNSISETKVDVAHEVAHQWFFSLVGDDEYLTPWTDEAFAQFSERRFNHTLPSLQQGPPVIEDVSSPVSAFPDSDFTSGSGEDYYMAIYQDGGRCLYDLMQQMGEPAFNKMMKAYVKQYEYRVTTTQDFIRFVSHAVGHDMTKWFADHFVNAQDDLNAPVMQWARAEMANNGRGWHG